MWSRRDQVQAYQFVRRRTVSAVLVGDANAARSPIRRTVTALLAGGLCLVLLLAGFVVYGLLRPGSSTSWRQSGAIVEEKETGARFVLGSDGDLHPVLNYTSARLLTGGDGTLTRVSRTSLAAAGRGPAVGIPGAPDALPPAKRMLTDPWLACSVQSGTSGPAQPPRLAVVVGPPARAPSILLGSGAAVVVRSAGQTYVVIEGRRLHVRGKTSQPVLDVLGLTQAPRVDVDSRWLATVPPGPDLGYLEVPGRGRPSTALSGQRARVGQVFRGTIAGSTTGQYFVLLTDGLAPISTTQARLLLGDPRTASAYPGQTPAERALPPAALAGARSAADLGVAAYPRRAPEALVFPSGDQVVLCSSPRGFTAGVPATAVYLGFADPVPVRSPQAGIGSGPGPATVAVPAGSGGLVRRASAPGVSTGAVYLVTDEGRRYVVPDAESRTALGYEKVEPKAVPGEFLDLLPTGPALDRAAAARSPQPPRPGSPPAGQSPPPRPAG
jgi:type VII secretion protein EccB